MYSIFVRLLDKISIAKRCSHDLYSLQNPSDLDGAELNARISLQGCGEILKAEND